MTAFQKIIKYSAIVFGVFLIVSVAIGLLNVIGTSKDISNEQLKTLELSDGVVSEISIDLGAMNLIVEQGETLSAQSNNDDLVFTQRNGKLAFKEKDTFFQKTVNGTLKIALPKDAVLSFVEIEMGAGSVKIEKMAAKRIEFDLGAGKVEITELTVQSAAEIECGAGELVLKKAEIRNLDMDLGVGKVTVEAMLYGNSEIDCGVGEFNLTLGKKSDYKIELSKGLGSIKVNGQKCEDFGIGGGENKVSVNGGVGAINLFFEEE